MYALRTNPNNRLRSCQACGEEFESWKSFLEHGKCVSDDDDSLLSSSPADSGGNCSTRKRSFRAKLTAPAMQISTEEEDLANYLMMLSNATAGADPTEPEESCASASRFDRHFSPISVRVSEKSNNNNKNKGLFECKACKKVFNSHQALGGHRASHKKVKGCFAARLNDNDNDNVVVHHEDHYLFSSPTLFPSENRVGSRTKGKSKVHECSICHRIFSSGQALGGHKRCHWMTSNSGAAPARFERYLKLDLNHPAESRGGVSTEIYLQPAWSNREEVEKKTSVLMNRNNNEDEGDSTEKLAKLSDELKDMNASEAASSTWLQLQVGIASTIP